MRILHVSDGPLSGAPYRLMQIQRLVGLEARLIGCNVNYGGRVFPHDLLVWDDAELIAHLVESADVIHYHNWWRQSGLFEVHPRSWEIARRKPSVIQFHSPRVAEYEEALREPSLIKLAVAAHHMRLYPECRPVPIGLPIDDPLHRPLGVDNAPPIVAFTPPHCEDPDDWNNKGCKGTLAVLRQGFRFRFITDAPWEEAMKLRQGCDIAIDEVVTGSYHTCSLEALSQGLATVAGLDATTLDVLERVTGTREHPWVVARLETLSRELTELVEDDGYRAAKRRQARSYMERYWSPEAVVGKFVDIYQEALARC